MKSKIPLVFFLMFSCLMVNAQQESDLLKDHAGQVHYEYIPHRTSGEAQQYSKEEEAFIIAKSASIAKYLQNNALIGKPEGVEITISSNISDKSPLSEWANNSLIFEIYFAVYPWYLLDGKPEYKCHSCHAYFTIHINDPQMAFYGLSIEGRDGIFDTDGSLMMIEPELAGEQDGCKLYKNQVIIIASEKAAWIPVTVKSYDEALIRYYEKRKKENPEEATSVFFIEKIKEEMSAFSSEELASPAYYGGRIGGCPANIEHTGAFVKLNPEYFDKTKPRTATQLIVLEVPSIAGDQATELYQTDEFSSFQAIRLAEILKSFKYAEWKRFFD